MTKTEPAGATPGQDLSGLRRASLEGKRARDAAELESIDRAYVKHVFRARPKKGADWLTDRFIRQVHKDMLWSIWDWAGKYRTSDLNIGVKSYQIPEQISLLCSDFSDWVARGHMPVTEIAARLQNRLTRIHPFKDGNGRHARLMTDIYFRSVGHRLPRWPQLQLLDQGDKIRRQYIEAMKKADQEDYGDLIVFIQECLKPEWSETR